MERQPSNIIKVKEEYTLKENRKRPRTLQSKEECRAILKTLRIFKCLTCEDSDLRNLERITKHTCHNTETNITGFIQCVNCKKKTIWKYQLLKVLQKH